MYLVQQYNTSYFLWTPWFWSYEQSLGGGGHLSLFTFQSFSIRLLRLQTWRFHYVLTSLWLLDEERNLLGPMPNFPTNPAACTMLVWCSHLNSLNKFPIQILHSIWSTCLFFFLIFISVKSTILTFLNIYSWCVLCVASTDQTLTHNHISLYIVWFWHNIITWIFVKMGAFHYLLQF